MSAFVALPAPDSGLVAVCPPCDVAVEVYADNLPVTCRECGGLVVIGEIAPTVCKGWLT